MPVGCVRRIKLKFNADKYAQKAYRTLYDTEGEYFCDDARAINPADVPDIDLICAGFPHFVYDKVISLFRQPDTASDSLIQEALSFMIIVALRLRSASGMKPGDLLIFSSKTSRGYSITKGANFRNYPLSDS